jgi:hypothetical protein
MKSRLDFLDVLRTFTIGLVVFHHVTLLYIPQFQIANKFVRNPVPDKFSTLFLLLIFLISGPMLNAIMFFIAGYFVFASYEKRGARAFVKDKITRLGIPYLFGLVILAPFTLFIARLSWDGNVKPGHFWIKEFFLPKTISPLHLWFIGILLFFFIVFTPLLGWLKKKKNEETGRKNYPRILIGKTGVHTPRLASVKFIITEKVVTRSSDRGMTPVSTINFLSNEDTSGLAPRFFIYILFLFATFAVYFGLNIFFKPYTFLSVYIVDFPLVMLPIYAG